MKTFRKKRSFINLLITLLIIGFTATGCGGDDNKTNSEETNNKPSPSKPGPAKPANTTASASLNKIKQSVQCQAGNTRLRDIIVPLTNGVGNSGSILTEYVGIDPYTRDILTIQKVKMSGTQTGLRAIISLCSYKSAYGDPIIAQEIKVGNFQFASLSLSTNPSNCSASGVNATLVFATDASLKFGQPLQSVFSPACSFVKF